MTNAIADTFGPDSAARKGLISRYMPRPRTGMFGLDISARRVKLLELTLEAGHPRIAAYASEPLAVDAVHDGQIQNAEDVARAVRRALARSATRTRRVAVAVSGPSVISKTIRMPADLSDTEIEQQIEVDAEIHLSQPLRDVFLDFQILERDPRDPRFNRVLLVACRRETVELRIAAMEMAGLSVGLVDVEEYALQNACALLDYTARSEQSWFAVFDVGALDMRLTVQHGSRSRYTRSIEFGGQAIAERLISRHGLADIEQLHSHLRTGELLQQDLAEDIAAFARNLATRIEQSLRFFLSANAESDQAIDRVVITGGVARYPGLAEALGGQLPWRVMLGNPLADMPVSAHARRNHVGDEAPALMIAAGLALRGLA